MSISTSYVEFKPASIVYNEVKRLLKSFNAANLIDEGEFPEMTANILKQLSCGVFRESKAIVKIKDYKGNLPSDFHQIYSAHRCCYSHTDSKDLPRKHYQGGYSFNIDVTDQFILSDNRCNFDCSSNHQKIIESIKVETYVTEDKCNYLNFNNFIPLNLSPNVDRTVCSDDNEFEVCSSPYEISIRDKKIYTNFDDDYVFIKYYGFPIDEEGELLIPDVPYVHNAVKWYIVYNILLAGWYNSSIPDIQNKWQKAEQDYKEAFAEAKYYNKLPAFSEILNMIRTTRANSKLVVLSNMHTKTNYQRGR